MHRPTLTMPLLQISKFIQKFDIDGDNRITFDEFLLFQTLLAIPLQDIDVAFRIIDKGAPGGALRMHGARAAWPVAVRPTCPNAPRLF